MELGVSDRLRLVMCHPVVGKNILYHLSLWDRWNGEETLSLTKKSLQRKIAGVHIGPDSPPMLIIGTSANHRNRALVGDGTRWNS